MWPEEYNEYSVRYTTISCKVEIPPPLPEGGMIWWHEHVFDFPVMLLFKIKGWLEKKLHRRLMFANKSLYTKCKHNK